ncbi:MAG: bifunctional [glutamine synthetase] adenylyltransferase/[glutamine synthetase]-adenylyl-L-tyrosine phosphorylase, partial [Propionibacteriaceae bacterium]
MSREESLQSRLARHFAAPQRAAQLCSEWETGPVLGLIECSADPDEVLLALTRIVAAKPELATRLATHDRLAATVIAVLGASDALGLQLARYCDDLDLLEAPQLLSLAEVHHATTPDELRRAYQRAVLAIAAVDLTAAEPSTSYPAIGAALAALADAVIETAIRLAQARCGVSELRLAAIAMGKTGAGELNYASDVDVIWVCDPLPGQSPQEAVTAASAVAAEVARICSAQTAAGTIWPVDANLRPEGKAGPLVRTVAAMDSYYSQWARPWEFQALLKARPMAGDRDVAQSFMELVRPRVWAVGDEPNFVGDTQAMRKRVVSLLTPLQRDRELKRAAGGLRDVEFTVQLLQLIHGRADSSLRCANTLDAIERLSAGGYIGRADARELDASYRTLRVLEHRVQLLKLRRTHLLPEAESALRRLSRGLGADVLHTWRQTSRAVLRLHERLFYSPVLAAVAHV